MDNWGRGWRKLVKWDKENRVYMYKDFRIIPLSYHEQVEMPIHLQNEYYWGEIERIDEVIKSRENKSNIDGQAELQKAMNIFWESVGL